MNKSFSVRLSALSLLANSQMGFLSTLFAFLFLLLTSFLVNIVNVVSIATAPYSILVKVKLLSTVLSGVFSTMSSLDVWFLVVISILFGINMGIIVEKVEIVKKGGKLSLAFGGGFVTLISAGCASCGLSIASLAGVGGVLSLLPFRGVEFYLLSIMILLISLYVNLGAFAKACRIHS